MAEDTKKIPVVRANPSTIGQFDIISNKTQKSVSLLNGILEMNYHENILDSTVRISVEYADTGSVTASTDGKSVLEGLPLVGSEKVSIKFQDNNDVTIGDDPIMDLYVNTVTPLYKDTTRSLVNLSLVSKEYLLNEKIRVITRFDGKISDHIEKILQTEEEYLNTEKKIDIEETSNNFTFVGNNKKPFYTMVWLGKKSVPGGTQGYSNMTAGFFFWETSEGFKFKSIDSLLGQKEKKKVIFNENVDDQGKDIPAAYQVKAVEYSEDSRINVQRKMQMGTYSTRIVLFNPFNCYYDCVVTNAKEDEKILTTAGEELPILNKEFDRTESGKDFSRTTYYINDTGTLPDGNTKQQIEKSRKENFEYINIENQSLRRFNQLFSEETIITIPGDFSIHAGDAIWIDSPQLKEEKKTDEVDELSGGLYVVSTLCHHMTSKGTWTKMSLMRDSVGRKIEKD